MIPFNRPAFLGIELDNIRSAIESGILSGEGNFGQKCESLVSKILGGSSTVLLTSSCTDALEMCALLLDIKDGDEVILPSYTFVSSALAFVLRGATPIFVDTASNFPNITPDEIEKAISPRTKAIVVVHYGGVACNMDAIMKIAKEHSIFVIEDAAHALGGKYKGRPLGSIGDLATFSFHETKNITCGEGGALVINDQNLVERAYVLRDKGTNRRGFKRGDVEFYKWVDVGSSFSMSDLLAAYLYAQLENLASINANRIKLQNNYFNLLRNIKASEYFELPDALITDDGTGHLFYILTDSSATRSKFEKYMRENSVWAVTHYQALHESPYVLKHWPRQRALPNTERFSQRLIRLPMFHSLTLEEQEYVVRLIEMSIFKLFKCA